MKSYAKVLKGELDAFIRVATEERYSVDIVHDYAGAMIALRRDSATPNDHVRIHRADAAMAKPLLAIRQQLLEQHSQWVYFERALRVYKPNATYLFKPMHRFHWLRGQAMVDAAEIIADRADVGAQ